MIAYMVSFPPYLPALSLSLSLSYITARAAVTQTYHCSNQPHSGVQHVARCPRRTSHSSLRVEGTSHRDQGRSGSVRAKPGALHRLEQTETAFVCLFACKILGFLLDMNSARSTDMPRLATNSDGGKVLEAATPATIATGYVAEYSDTSLLTFRSNVLQG
jgi:hypothetical protein